MAHRGRKGSTRTGHCTSRSWNSKEKASNTPGFPEKTEAKNLKNEDRQRKEEYPKRKLGELRKS